MPIPNTVTTYEQITKQGNSLVVPVTGCVKDMQMKTGDLVRVTLSKPDYFEYKTPICFDQLVDKSAELIGRFSISKGPVEVYIPEQMFDMTAVLIRMFYLYITDRKEWKKYFETDKGLHARIADPKYPAEITLYKSNNDCGYSHDITFVFEDTADTSDWGYVQHDVRIDDFVLSYQSSIVSMFTYGDRLIIGCSHYTFHKSVIFEVEMDEQMKNDADVSAALSALNKRFENSANEYAKYVEYCRKQA